MHGGTLYTSNSAGAIWRLFKLSLEMHGAILYTVLQIVQELYGDHLNEAAWSHRVYIKYYNSHIETF